MKCTLSLHISKKSRYALTCAKWVVFAVEGDGCDGSHEGGGDGGGKEEKNKWK